MIYFKGESGTDDRRSTTSLSGSDNVDLVTAILAKGCGFDWVVWSYYTYDSSSYYVGETQQGWNEKIGYISCPTIGLLESWLVIELGVTLWVSPTKKGNYYWNIKGTNSIFNPSTPLRGEDCNSTEIALKRGFQTALSIQLEENNKQL